MEDTTKKKKTTNGVKKNKNHEPKWKAKKTNSNKTVEKKEKVKKETNKEVEVEEKKISINKKESGKKVDRQRLTDKFNIEKTVIFNLPSKEELDKIYEEMKQEECTEENSLLDNEAIATSDNHKSIKARIHYNFLSRICALLVLILLFLVLCIFFIFKAIDYQLGGSTKYSEYTTNKYNVCMHDGNCLEKDLDYNSNDTKKIHVTFDYESVYSRNYSFNYNYYVKSTMKIYDRNDSSNIRYSKDDFLIDSTNLKVNGEVITFSADVDIDFANYRSTAIDYINRVGTDLKAELNVGLYLKDKDGSSREVSNIIIPLTEDTFTIKSLNLDLENQLVISNFSKREVDPFYIFIAIICLLMDILLCAYVANFIYMVKHLDNKYNTLLKRILREHDDIIVNATSAYTIPEDSRIVKVESFDELLDARNSLEKPIVYEKINNVKSKFYLEDDKTIFVYTLKDEGE